MRISILIALLGTLLIGLAAFHSKDDEVLYKVVWLRGKPLTSNKTPFRDGQKILQSDQLLFTTLQDVVVLMNNRFDRVYLKPRTRDDLHKFRRVGDYFSLERGKSDFALSRIDNARNITGNTRGGDNTRYFQSISDTLRINVPEDLKMTDNPDANRFQLFDLEMEALPNALKKEGSDLLVTFKKPGLYFLYSSGGSHNSRMLAQLEFFEPKEVQAELRFVALSSSPSDSSRPNQIRFLRKLYPHVPQRQMLSLVKP